MKRRIVDLFSGCGGFSLGAAAAGLTPSVAFDVDPILTSSFSFNHPKTRLVLTDLSQISGQSIIDKVGGPITGVFGGPPCQPFSAIGRRQVGDPRRDMVSHFFRLVGEMRPAFFVMENVRGLGFAGSKQVLDDALSLLPSFYRILGPLVLDAADFGAATRRKRLFVIGYDPSNFDDLSAADIQGRFSAPATVEQAIADLSSARLINPKEDLWKITHRGRPSAYAAMLRNKNGTFTGHARTVHSETVAARFQKLAPGKTDVVGRHHRLDWNSQCPTLRAGTGNDRGSYQSVRPIHPSEPRVITVREAARLQGFPDDFVFHPTVWHSFRMIGNSVSPIISKAIFSLLSERLGVSLPVAAE